MNCAHERTPPLVFAGGLSCGSARYCGFVLAGLQRHHSCLRPDQQWKDMDRHGRRKLRGSRLSTSSNRIPLSRDQERRDQWAVYALRGRWSWNVGWVRLESASSSRQRYYWRRRLEPSGRYLRPTRLGRYHQAWLTMYDPKSRHPRTSRPNNFQRI